MFKKVLVFFIIILVLSGAFYLVKYKSNILVSKNINHKQQFISAVSSSKYQENANCLYTHLDDFKADNVVIAAVNDYNDIESLFTNDNKVDINRAVCKTTFSEIEKFINHNFIKISKTNPGVVQSWNYLAINKKVIYDGLRDIKLDARKSDGTFSDKALVYEFNESFGVDGGGHTSYSLDSIINNQIICYTAYTETWNMPHASTNYQCASLAGNGYVLNDLFNGKEIIKTALQDSNVKEFLHKQKVDLSKITSFEQLSTILAKSAVDSEGKVDEDDSCLPFSTSNFTINKQNADGTLDILYDPDVRWLCYGDGLIYPADLKYVQPKIKISKFVLPNQL